MGRSEIDLSAHGEQSLCAADHRGACVSIILRPDQLSLKFDINAAWNSGARTVMAVLPTGGGKSIVVSDLINDHNMLGAQ